MADLFQKFIDEQRKKVDLQMQTMFTAARGPGNANSGGAPSLPKPSPGPGPGNYAPAPAPAPKPKPSGGPGPGNAPSGYTPPLPVPVPVPSRDWSSTQTRNAARKAAPLRERGIGPAPSRSFDVPMPHTVATPLLPGLAGIRQPRLASSGSSAFGGGGGGGAVAQEPMIGPPVPMPAEPEGEPTYSVWFDNSDGSEIVVRDGSPEAGLYTDNARYSLGNDGMTEQEIKDYGLWSDDLAVQEDIPEKATLTPFSAGIGSSADYEMAVQSGLLPQPTIGPFATPKAMPAYIAPEDAGDYYEEPPDPLGKAGNLIGDIYSGVRTVIENPDAVVNNAIGPITDVVDSVGNVVGDIYSGVRFVQGNPDAVRDAVLGPVEDVVDAVQDFAKHPLLTIGNLTDAAVDAVLDSPVGEWLPDAALSLTALWEDVKDDANALNNFAPVWIDLTTRGIKESGIIETMNRGVDFLPAPLRGPLKEVVPRIIEWSGWAQNEVAEFIFDNYADIVESGKLRLGPLEIDIPDSLGAALTIIDEASRLTNPERISLSRAIREGRQGAALDWIRGNVFDNTLIGYAWVLGFQVITDPLTYAPFVGPALKAVEGTGAAARFVRTVGRGINFAEGASDLGLGYAAEGIFRGVPRIPGIRRAFAPTDETRRALEGAAGREGFDLLENTPVSNVPGRALTVEPVTPNPTTIEPVTPETTIVNPVTPETTTVAPVTPEGAPIRTTVVEPVEPAAVQSWIDGNAPEVTRLRNAGATDAEIRAAAEWEVRRAQPRPEVQGVVDDGAQVTTLRGGRIDEGDVNVDSGPAAIQTTRGAIDVSGVPRRFQPYLRSLVDANDLPSVQALIDDSVADGSFTRQVQTTGGPKGTARPSNALDTAEFTADFYDSYRAINPNAILPAFTPSRAAPMGPNYRNLERAIHQPWADTAASRAILQERGIILDTVPGGTLTREQIAALNNYVRLIDQYKYWNPTAVSDVNFAEASRRADAIAKYFTDRPLAYGQNVRRGAGGVNAPPPGAAPRTAANAARTPGGTTAARTGGMTTPPAAQAVVHQYGDVGGYPIRPGTATGPNAPTIVRIDADTDVALTIVPRDTVPPLSLERFPNDTTESWTEATLIDAKLDTPVRHYAPTREAALDLAVQDAQGRGLVGDFFERPANRQTSEALDVESTARQNITNVKGMPKAGQTRGNLPNGVKIAHAGTIDLGGTNAPVWKVTTPDGSATIVKEGTGTYRVAPDDVVDENILADMDRVPSFETGPDALVEAQMQAKYGVASEPTTGTAATPTAPVTPETTREFAVRTGIVDEPTADALDTYGRTRSWSDARKESVYTLMNRINRKSGQPVLDVGDLSTATGRRQLGNIEEIARLQEANEGIIRSMQERYGPAQDRIDALKKQRDALPTTDRSGRDRLAKQIKTIDEGKLITGSKRQKLQASIDKNRAKIRQLEDGLRMNNRVAVTRQGDFETSALGEIGRSTVRQKALGKAVRSLKTLVVQDVPVASMPMPSGLRQYDGMTYLEGVPIYDKTMVDLTKYVFDNGDTVLDRISRKINDFRANPTMWDGTNPGEILDRAFRETRAEYEGLLDQLFPTKAKRTGPLRSFGIATGLFRDSILANWLTGWTRYVGTQYLGNLHLGFLSGPDNGLALAKRTITSQKKVRALVKETYDVTGANPVRVAEDMMDFERFDMAAGLPPSSSVLDINTGEYGQRRTELGNFWESHFQKKPPAPLRAVFGDEGVYREGLYADTINRATIYENVTRRQIAVDERAFDQQARARLTEAGLDEAAVNAAMADFYGSVDMQWGWKASDVRNHFSTHVDEIIADRLARDWQNAITLRRKFANDEVKRITFGGSGRTKLDDFLSNFILFHYFQSRQVKFLTTQALKHPAILNFYVHSQEAMNDYADAHPEMPSWLRGSIKAAEFLGVATYLVPTALFQVGSIYGNPADILFEDPNQTWLSKKLATKIPFIGGTVEDWFFINPVINQSLNLFGFLSDDRNVDILNTNQWGRLTGLVVNIGANKGWWSEPGEMIGNPVANFWNKGRDWASGIGLPGSVEVDYVDTVNNEERKLNALIVDVAEADGLNPADPEDYAIIEAAKQDPNHKYYKEAWGRYVQGEAVAIGVKSTPFLASFRPQTRLLNSQGRDLMLNQTGWNEAALRNTTDPEVGEFKSAAKQYYALGDPFDPVVDGLYTDLVYNEVVDDVTLDGKTYTAKEINSWDEDTRKDFAAAFLVDNGLYEEWQDYQNEQAEFLADPENAAFAQYHSWDHDVRHYEGGVEKYWQDVIADNPNAKRWYEQIDPDLTDEERTKVLTGQRAFMAVKGNQFTYDDPTPIETNDFDPVNIANGPATPIVDEPYVSEFEEGFYSDYNNFVQYANEAEPVMNQIMVDWGMDPNIPFNGYTYHTREDLKSEYYSRTGYPYPEPKGAVLDYFQWVSKQRPGSDLSPEAYLEWSNEQYTAKMPSAFNEDIETTDKIESGKFDPIAYVDRTRSKDPGFSWEDDSYYWDNP